MDIIIRIVDGYGFLPIVKDESGTEIFRGSYRRTAEAALELCTDRLEEIK